MHLARTFAGPPAILLTTVALGLSIMLSAAWLATPAQGQTIPIRTVPVASGDQFRLLPSVTDGMGSVRFAVDDSLADPWSNPAKGSRNGSSLFMGSPTFYGFSDDGGGGRSFPVAGMIHGSSSFGGASLALQQIENVNVTQNWWTGTTLNDRFGRNVYATGYLGRRLGAGPWSVGVGISGANLEAMDGVDLLYAGSDRIEQSGSLSDFRLGVTRDGVRDRWALELAHSRLSMAHEVSYSEWFWDEPTQTQGFAQRVERNQDQTRTWAGAVNWDRALEAAGWRIGVSGAMNYKTHPKIPNYSIQNIPRDPGTTWAYEVGFGFSKSDETTTFGLDVALQPIWSNTWQVANATDVVDSGGRLAVGDRSIENEFFFTNVMLRTGLSHVIGRVTVQGGLDVRSYDYQLDQLNRVTRGFRDQSESWTEWTPTLGGAFAFQSMDLRYALRVTNGTGLPGVAWGGRVQSEQLAAGGDFILAPDGPLTLFGVRVVTHQIAVTIPVR